MPRNNYEPICLKNVPHVPVQFLFLEKWENIGNRANKIKASRKFSKLPTPTKKNLRSIFTNSKLQRTHFESRHYRLEAWCSTQRERERQRTLISAAKPFNPRRIAARCVHTHTYYVKTNESNRKLSTIVYHFSPSTETNNWTGSADQRWDGCWGMELGIWGGSRSWLWWRWQRTH